MLDILIRNARVIDGSGANAFESDVGVRDGAIVDVGHTDEPSRKTVDAGGLALMPGIVDVHTHYDAQVTWDATLSPSVSLGVTSVVMGNCGFGIAPCPPHLRETLLRNLSVVEGMDVEALLAGTRWDFGTFPQYLDMLERSRPPANAAVLAQHSTIRNAVMGEEASSRNVPSSDQLREMQRLVSGSLDAGSSCFAPSFSPNHSGWGGRPVPSTVAADEELRSLVGVLGEEQPGIFVLATGPRATPEFMESLAPQTPRPMFIVTRLTMDNHAPPPRPMEKYEPCAE